MAKGDCLGMYGPGGVTDTVPHPVKRMAKPPKRAFGFLLAAGLCSFMTNAPAAHAQPAGKPPAAPTAAVLPTERCGDYFIAEAQLNGRGPFRLLLDTGNPRTLLTPRVADALGARGRLDSVVIGTMRARGHIRFAVRDLAQISRTLRTHIDGILGYDVFDGVLLTYDYSAGAVRVRKGTLADDRHTLPMSRGQRPFIRAIVGADTIALLLDTGFSGGLALAGFDDLEFRDTPRLVGARLRMDGFSLRYGGRLAHDVDLRAFALRQPVVINAEGRNLLGQDVLRHFTVTLDRARGRVRFEPTGDTAAVVIELPPLRGTGIVAQSRADHLHVMRVIDGSPADAAGVAAGDRIVAVDGVPTADRGCAAPNDAEAASPTVLTMERDGARRDVAITPVVIVP